MKLITIPHDYLLKANGAKLGCHICHGSGVMPFMGNFVSCTQCFPPPETYVSNNTNPPKEQNNE